MIFTVGVITACPGGNHLIIPVTVGSQTRTIIVSRGDMQADIGSIEEAIELMKNRMRSELKENNAANLSQIKTTLDNKSFEL